MDKHKNSENKQEQFVHLNEEEADSKVLDQKDEKILRLAAELENTRNRIKREIDQACFMVLRNFALDICEIVDNLDRAKSLIKTGDSTNSKVLQGINMIIASIEKLFVTHGISRVITGNNKFNPNLHEAVGEEESKEIPEYCIVREVQAGYLLNGKLLRPAKVILARGLKQDVSASNGDNEDKK